MNALAPLLIALAACSATTPPSAVTPRPPVDTRPPACAPASPVRDATADRRADIAAELGKLDAELDAIDAELAAAAQNHNRSLTDAQALAIERKAILAKTQLDDTPVVASDAPVLLRRATRALLVARAHELELAGRYGPRHSKMQKATQRTAYARRVAQEQLANERAFAQAWIDALAALPAKAKPDAIYKARLEAIRATLAASPSSESPANVRVAFETLRDVTAEHDAIAAYAGPKNPELVAAAQRLADAKAAFARAVTDADATLAARIAAPVRTADGALIARRAELAESARVLRDEYQLLVR